MKETGSCKGRHEICLCNETERGQDFGISLSDGPSMGTPFQDVKQKSATTTSSREGIGTEDHMQVHSEHG